MTAVLQVLLDPILAVFAILALGFAMGRTGATDLGAAQAINRFAMTVLIPLFVFDVIAHAPIREFSFAPLGVYALVEAAVFAFGYGIARGLFGRPPNEAILLGLTGIFVNNALYILPMSVLLYGSDGVLPITAIVTLDSIVVFGCAMVALQTLQMGKAAPLKTLGSVLRMPMIIGLILGIVAGWLALDLPAPVETFLAFNGAAAGPVALFALGVALSQTRFSASALVLSFTGLKLVLFPLLVWASMTAVIPDRPETALFILSAAGPSGAMAFSLAMLYGVRSDAIAQIIVWTSLLSLISLALLA
jgi:predicted permease